MPRYINPYATPRANYMDSTGQALANLGNGMNTIATAMIGKMKTPEEKALLEAQMQANLAHGRYYDAAAREKASEVDARQNFESNYGKTIFGSPEAAQEALSFSQGRMMGPMPQSYTPDNAERYQRGLEAMHLAQASGEKNIGTLMRQLLEGNTARQVMSGQITPTLAGQAMGATGTKIDGPFKQGQFGMGNELTGTLTDNRLFDSAVKENNAQANNYNASAGEHGARRKQIESETELVPMQIRKPDGTIGEVMVPRKGHTNAEARISAAEVPKPVKGAGATGKGGVEKFDPKLMSSVAQTMLHSLGVPKEHIETGGGFDKTGAPNFPIGDVFENPQDYTNAVSAAMMTYNGLVKGGMNPTVAAQQAAASALKPFGKNQYEKGWFSTTRIPNVNYAGGGGGVVEVSPGVTAGNW